MNAKIRIIAGLLISLMAVSRAEAVTITVQGGTGFNDATVVVPVGGNTGVTLGQQRTNVFNTAATIWGERLQGSVPIVVTAKFSDFADNLCSNNSGTLGRAGATEVRTSNSPKARSGVFYSIAEANAFAGSDLNGAPAEINGDFNADVDTRADCLGGRGFYYGLDNNPGSKIDLLNVVVHEFAHGLGFFSLVDAATGVNSGGSTFGIYDNFLFDETTTLTWPQMTNAQRVASAINTGNLTWNGPLVTAAAPALIVGLTNGRVRMFAPNPVQPGSSVSHWDSVATPNLLMEPVLTSSVRGATRVDFTTCLLSDIGWTVVPSYGCPDNGFTNTPPTAGDDSYTVAGNSATAVLAVRANDTDPDAGQTLSVTTVGTPAPAGSATVAIAGGGTDVSFTPATGFVGALSFPYTVSDGSGGSASATVTVNVTAPPPPPPAPSGGGGGAMPLSVLLTLLGMAALRRRGRRN